MSGAVTLSEEEDTELRYAAKRITEILGVKTASNNAAANPDWRVEAPTEKQLDILKKNGFATQNLTRGKASDIIDGIFKKRKEATR
jgi:hypothetical protein